MEMEVIKTLNLNFEKFKFLNFLFNFFDPCLACLFALRKQIFLFGIGGKPE
jgi:hypothetical protein